MKPLLLAQLLAALSGQAVAALPPTAAATPAASTASASANTLQASCDKLAQLVLGISKQAAQGVSRDDMKKRMSAAAPEAQRAVMPMVEYVYDNRGKQSDQAMADHYRQSCLSRASAKAAAGAR